MGNTFSCCKDRTKADYILDTKDDEYNNDKQGENIAGILI